MVTERRNFTRVPFNSEAIITAKEDLRITGSIENLGLKGVLIKVSQKLEIGRDVEVTITLAEPASDITVELNGTVARHTPDAMGIEFTGMYLDVFERLRDLLTSILGDKKMVVEEFLAYMAKPPKA